MFNVKTFAAAAAAAIMAASAANATTISVSAFTEDGFDAYQSGNILAYQNFESFDAPVQYSGGLTGTNVGDFTSLGGTGEGTSIIDDGTDLAVDNNAAFGRVNTTNPGENWLSSNDTDGILWNASAGGSLFNSVAFSLSDIADTGATLTVTADGTAESFSGLGNGEVKWVVISFGSFIDSAKVSLENTDGAINNDGFGIDDVTIAAVPLPAGAALMLTGLGGLAIARRRKAVK